MPALLRVTWKKIREITAAPFNFNVMMANRLTLDIKSITDIHFYKLLGTQVLGVC